MSRRATPARELAQTRTIEAQGVSGNVPSPVPIELKLLDKGWTGPRLCERLRNQFAGDYLREASGGCGLMLVMWLGERPARRWRIDGRLVGLSGLEEALKRHWAMHANGYPNVEAIEVVVVDLGRREGRSGS